MAGVLSDVYKVASLEAQRGGGVLWSEGNSLQYGLFTGATVPDHATVLADLTELTGTGYGRDVIEGWSEPTLTDDFKARMQSESVSFVNEGVVDWDEVTGWFWVLSDGTTLVRSGRYDTPFTLAAGGIHTILAVWTRDGD